MNVNKTDIELKNDVLSELKYEPSVKTSDIGVLVKDGAVTLNGFATSYWEKANAVSATKRVAGVAAIADDIKINLPGTQSRTDGDIAEACAQQIQWAPSIPTNSVKIVVRGGWVTLDGDVEWWFQKNAAENAVHFLTGVKGVSNMITIKPKLSPADIESDIRCAFKRHAMLDAEEIIVETSGDKVTLRGKVRTYAEKEQAERTAWTAPGVQTVVNDLTVNWSWLGK
jgi:osmotically-inducible protein OsmY